MISKINTRVTAHCQSRRSTSAYFRQRKPPQLSEDEFDRLLCPLLGQRYAVELIHQPNISNMVYIMFDQQKDTNDLDYFINKAVAFELLNVWGIASSVHTQVVKELITYSDGHVTLPILISTPVSESRLAS